MKRKTARQPLQAPLTGIGRLFAIPRPSYSTAELVGLLSDEWTEKYALLRIRYAVEKGLLHPFRRGTVNEFTFEEVVQYVCSDSYPSTSGELVNAALLSGFAFAYLPSSLLLEVLQEAAAGRWRPDPCLSWPIWHAGPVTGDPVTGTRLNPGFPAATRDSHVARVDRGAPDDRVPHSRTRIRAASVPKSERKAKRASSRGEPRAVRPVSDDELELRLPAIDNEPAEISLDVINRAQYETREPRPRRRPRK